MQETSILITGAGSGIGFCAANTLKKRGYRVFAGARKSADIKQLTDLGLEAVSLDLTDSDSLKRGLDQVLSATGGTLDALFNNAATMQVGAIEDLNRDLMRAQFETNTFGTMELTQLVLPIMRRQGHGRIVQNSSILGLITMPFYGAYNASKFALEGFSNTLRQELRGTTIHVSIINPGPITSKLRENAFKIYQETIKNNPNSVHLEMYRKLEEAYFHPNKKDQRFFLTEEAVVEKLILALESKRPKAHYSVGIPANVFAFLRRILSDNTLDWLLTSLR